ncbi:methyl-accepting chemotaxis protein [Thiomicrorhabdus sp. ZW0627]|uniref:methyl-accepting chemotaxis protein n=1 Tax=Thiomicrorhabdus sp. ZW0627 TaxID=3039774 RepID=UPI002436C765|nr:methyl-accepting chemotaxis protein [Thiomicrorhabdus sp. ZW0627]MDG6774799.1 methyl-accepting chemotaxis protein [Thiomicrorhabdus sp. ZW0627]
MSNSPNVTQQEYFLKEDLTIVSRTDLVGNILEANEAFIEASGYDWKELVGKPHNILRHPDVPAAVFKDFWSTIQAGKPWSQIVKNRRKNGDHYWVVANATPIFEKGEIVGYMSVRTPASEEQKHIATQAYNDISTGRIKLVNGEIQTLKSRFDIFNHFNLTTIVSFLSSLLLISIFTSLTINTGIPSSYFEIFDILIILVILYATHVNGKRLKELEGYITSISEGNFNNPIKSQGKSLISRVLGRLKSMQIKLGADFDDTKASLNNAKRIESALDSASSNIMVADRFRSIIFMNQSVRKMLKKIEADIQKDLPEFDADNLIRQSIDVFHKHPQHQQSILENLTKTYNARIHLGKEIVDLVVDPIFDEKHDRIGTVAEWKLMTIQLAIEDEIEHIVSDAAKGNLNGRIQVERLSGFEKTLSLSINQLLDSFAETTQSLNIILSHMSDGDLSQRLHGEFEGELLAMKVAINNALSNIALTFGKVKLGSQEISNMSKEVAVASEDLSDRTQQQAASLEQTAATMEELTATLQLSAEHSEKANEIAHDSAEQAENGVGVMNKTMEAMNGISELSKKIGEITSVIDGIAFQTNLLALNAAVEAARAGEHGRGFAVVAGEVRNLAQKSAESSKEISALITTASSQIETGTELVNQTGLAFQEMVDKIHEVETLVSEVSTTTAEQAKGISEVNQAVANLDQMTQQNAALVEQLSATAGNMNSQATTQAEFVDRFKLGDMKVSNHSLAKSIDFAEAKMMHLSWNVKLENLLADQKTDIDHQAARDYKSCPLGKWILSEGQKYNGLPAMQSLITIHKQFHETLGQVIQAKEEGNLELAQEVKDKFVTLSDKVMDAIDHLEEAVGRQAIENSTVKLAKPASPENQATAGLLDKTVIDDFSGKSPKPQNSEWGEF